jgi:ribosomal protein S27AE
MTLLPEERENIAKVLAERGVTLPCPRCGDSNWKVLDAYISNPLTQDVENVIVGGPVLPTVAVICTKCGFVAEHLAAAILE